MTHVYNAETGFKDEFLEGLTAAYGRYLRRVPSASGVMSVTAPARGRASVLIGGGSGHAVAATTAAGPHGSDVLTAAGAAFSEAAGGASGALWGAGLAAPAPGPPLARAVKRGGRASGWSYNCWHGHSRLISPRVSIDFLVPGPLSHACHGVFRSS